MHRRIRALPLVPAQRGARLRRNWLRAAIAVLSLVVPVAAMAQAIGNILDSDIPFSLKGDQGTTVADRPHTELEPVGIHTGSFVLFPEAATGLGYTTNVYGQTTNPSGDAFVMFAPQARLVSQWSRNFLELSGSAGIRQFFKQTVRSEAAYSFQTDGRIDLGQGESNIIGLLHYGRAYEAQYSGSFPKNAAGTVGYDQLDGTVRSTFVFNRLRLIESERFNDLRYLNATSLAGQILPQNYRNRTEYNSSARLEYGFTPDFALFGEGAYNIARYHDTVPGQPLRSNHTLRLLGGLDLDPGKLIRAAVGVGYEQRHYDSPFYVPLRGLAFDGRAQWLVTELTTISLDATRKAQDAINANSPGYFATIGQLRIDHELLRYLLLHFEVSRERDAFIALDRRDTQNQVSAGAIYAVGRHLKIMPTLWYIDRNSVGSKAGQTFKEVRFLTEISWQL